MISIKQTSKNIRLNKILYAIHVVIGFFSIPYFIKNLGTFTYNLIPLSKKRLLNSSLIAINIFTNKTTNIIYKIYNLIKWRENGEKPLIAYWYKRGGGNWGDVLNPILIQNISGKEPVFVDEIINLKNEPVYSVVGSILGLHANKNLIVWGSGFISSSSQFKEIPRKICAVRGPLTRDSIIKQNIECPEIYGDPALLYPLFYKPVVNKKYQLGIIPHYIDQKNSILNNFKDNPEVLIIDITAGINEVVDNICMCERIASSSLHGVIVADAYRIPSIWIEFSNKVLGSGFKFFDYFMSVGRKNEKSLSMTENTRLKDIYNQYHEYKINIDLISLIESCPFILDSEINKLKKMIETMEIDTQ